MIKILMISTDRALFDKDSAVCARLREQAALVAELHVIVFTPQGKQFTRQQIGKKLTLYPTTSLGKWSYLPDALALARMIVATDGHPDQWLITTQDPFEIGALGYLLARLLSIPLHLQIHTDPWSPAWQGVRFGNRMRFALMRYLLRYAAGVRVVSKRVEASVLREGIPAERITRIPIYTDIAFWKDATPQFDLHQSYHMFKMILLSIGRLQPEKNFSGLIRAFARVRRIHADAMLLIVGSGPERARLVALADSLGLRSAVTILPWARDVASYYKTSDVYLQPSLYEGYGLAVVEAMASGAPVIMTDVGVAGDLVRNGETGMVVPVGDEQALVDAMVEMLNDATLRKALANAGGREVERCLSKTETLAAYKTSWLHAYAYGHQKTQTTKK